VNIYIGAAILIAVCLVLGKIFDWFGEKTGVILIAVLGGALVSLLFAAGVHALTEANMPAGCKTTYVC
jgi:ABC-type uncharacterized transport system permease subunit